MSATLKAEIDSLTKSHHYLRGYKDGKAKTLKQMRWISAKERLPKPNEYVGNVAKYYLVQNEYGDMLVARYRGYWEQIYQHEEYTDKIIAWMELPQPFEEEKGK